MRARVSTWYKLGQVGIEHDLLAADEVDSALYHLHGHGQLIGRERRFVGHSVLKD
jgi:hypothetical protein